MGSSVMPEGAVSVTMEELEQSQKSIEAPVAANLAEVKLEGEEIPQELRGKSAAEAIGLVKALSESLRLSEQARAQAELTAQTAIRTSQPAPVAEETKEVTDEELARIHEEDPLRAIRLMNDQAIRQAEKNLEQRLGPLFQGSSASAEANARSKYGDEFALFGDQIAQIVSTIPGSKTVMANPQAWDDLVSLVRGRPGNLERLIEKKTAVSATQRLAEAQKTEADAVGFTVTGGQRRAAPKSVAQLDPIQREIAEKLDMTPEEYVRWSQI